MAMLNDQRVSLRILAEESHFFFARKIDGRLFFAFVRKLQFEIEICFLNLGQMKIWPFLVGIWIFKGNIRWNMGWNTSFLKGIDVISVWKELAIRKSTALRCGDIH